MEAEPAAPQVPDTVVEAQPTSPLGSDYFDPSADPYNQPTDRFSDILQGTDFTSPPVAGYNAESATIGGLVETPNMLFPGTVNVVPQDLLKDQQVLSFQDALRDIGGATPAGDGLFADKFFLRGMEVFSRDMRKDGFLDPTYTPRDFSNIDRVEVLKGPSSILYGATDAVGTVNFVSKRPLDTTFQNIYYTFGSFNQQRVGVDVNGRAVQSGRLIYRLNAVTEDTDSFRDFGYVNRTLIAPGVTYAVSEDTTVTFLGEYHTDDRRGDRGIPAIGGNVFAVPRNRYVGEPANDFLHYEDYRATMMVNHRFNDNWTGYVGMTGLWYEFPGSQTGAAAQVGPTQFLRLRQDVTDQESTGSLIANLSGNFDTGCINHKMVIGTEQVYYTSRAFFGGDLLPPIDVINPVYTNPPTTGLSPYSAAFPSYRQSRNGYYLNDLMNLGNGWYAMGGVRFDHLALNFDRDYGFGNIESNQEFDQTSPRGGLLYELIPDVLTTYYSYSRSFAPPYPAAYPFDSRPLQPVLGEMHEAGIKTQLLPNLTMTVAGFHTVRQNTAFFNPNTFQFFQIGENTSQGVDVNIIGDVTDNLSLVANWVYADTALNDPNNPILVGQPNLNVPLHTFNVWGRYDLIENQTHTFGLALGMVHLSTRSGNISDTLVLPAYTRWDGGVYYTRGRWAANVYIENIFDIDYIQSSIDEFQLQPGAPTNARATLSATF